MYHAEIILTGPPYFQCKIEAPKTKKNIYVSQLGVVPSDSWQTKVSEECDKEYCLQEGSWGIEQVFVTELASGLFQMTSQNQFQADCKAEGVAAAMPEVVQGQTVVL